MSDPSGICQSLWGLWRRRVEEPWPWWLAHSSLKMRQELVSPPPPWGQTCLTGYWGDHSPVGPGGPGYNSVMDTQHFKFASVLTRPAQVHEPKGRRGRDQVDWCTPPSSTRPCLTEHCWLQCGLLKRFLLHRQKWVKCCICKGGVCIYLPLGLEVCTYFCCPVLSITTKVNACTKEIPLIVLQCSMPKTVWVYFISSARLEVY